MTTADTDHFDDAVIIHELGHRIEDNCGKMDSPGGTHNGLFRIDPRLAWSEGWGNFMGAHIIKNKLSSINPDPALTTILGAPGWVYYLDTTGYKDGTSGTADELIRLNLTKTGSNPEILQNNSPITATCGVEDYCYDKVDSVVNPGEGHFREVSIARSLFKISNVCASGCTNRTDYFDKIWMSMNKITGIGQAIYPFRSSARFYNRMVTSFLGSMPASIDATLNSDEAQQRSGSTAYLNGVNIAWPPYGIKLVSSVPICTFEIQPKNEDPTVTNTLTDQRYSNHFFNLATPTGFSSLTLTSTKAAGTTPASVDIDLILYQEGYQYVPDSAGIKTTTSTQFIRSDRSSGLTKSITSLETLGGATNYLLNVRAFTTGGAISSDNRYTYTLRTNTGEYLCPSPTF